jgi:hypothetical protein
MTELASGRDAPESDREFDVRHGTDTAGSVEPGDSRRRQYRIPQAGPARRAFHPPPCQFTIGAAT